MLKFRKKCSNPFHSEWNIEEIDLPLVVVRAYGLAEVLGAFKADKVGNEILRDICQQGTI